MYKLMLNKQHQGERLWSRSTLHGVERLSERFPRLSDRERADHTRTELINYLQGVEPLAEVAMWEQWKGHR